LRTGSFALALSACVGVPPSGAQAVAPLLTDAREELVVGIVTMGQGDYVYELFGHNAIWIRDSARGTDWVYNYGIFDFDSPGYWWRFVTGNWLYTLAVDDLSSTLATYRYWNRSVWVQVLNLTPAQKRELRDFLEWNALPENREYLYDYFRDNCSTRVRDALDAVIGGALRASTQGVPTGTTYRSHSERLIASDRVSYTGLLAALGPAADREIDAWEEMFVPFELQRHIRHLEVTDEAGSPVPLVAREGTLFEAMARDPVRTQPPRWGHWYLLGGMALAGAFLLLGRSSFNGGPPRAVLAVLGSCWSLLLGVVGLVLLGMWALTNHTIAYRNENLLHINPLALGLAVLLPALVYGGRWVARPARVLAMTLAGLSVAGVLLKVLPWFSQDNWSLIAVLLPAHLSIAWVVSSLSSRIDPVR
jgi:hypothetical protein